MFKVAIIQFPGLNTEYETRREIERAGMKADFFRWNESPEKLKKYDAYVIGGGFSYEDRGRAGIIAALDPIMEVIKQQAGAGKPLLGICNGAQIVLESGLIPHMALARNKRVRIENGELKVLGTGYYNAWVYMKALQMNTRCVFTRNFGPQEIITAPIAHGEGRYTTEESGLISQLQENNQIVFRYCDKTGIISEQFPVNPNGAMYNIAALCNPEGNVMAIMPHLERSSEASYKLFTSLRDSLEESKKGKKLETGKVNKINVKTAKESSLPKYSADRGALKMHVKLIITDHEAETLEMALRRLGFDISLSRESYFEIGLKAAAGAEKSAKMIVQSGVLLNTNKETGYVMLGGKMQKFESSKGKFVTVEKEKESGDYVSFQLLVRERQDFVGMSKADTLIHRLKMKEVKEVKTGVLWTIKIPTKSQKVADQTFKKILGTSIFYNPHRQEAWMV